MDRRRAVGEAWSTLRRPLVSGSSPIEKAGSVAELVQPAFRAIDGHHECVNALVAGGKLGPPAGTADAYRAALLATQLAGPGRRRRLNISQPTAPLTHPRPGR